MQRKTIILLIIEALIFLSVIAWGYHYFDRKLDISNQNTKAYKETIEQLELNNGELITVRDSYILTIKDLEDKLDVSKKEIKEIQRKLDSSVAYISKIESQIKIDTIETVRDSIIYKEKDKFDIYFSYEDQWTKFKGISSINQSNSTTSIYDLYINTPLKVGLTDDYQIFVQSQNPHLKITEIEGSVIDGSKLYPKTSKWSWGVQGGLGICYDLITKEVGIGPYIGVGVEKKF